MSKYGCAASMLATKMGSCKQKNMEALAGLKQQRCCFNEEVVV